MHHLLGLPVYEAYADTRERAAPPPMRAERLRHKFKGTAVVVIDEISMVSPVSRPSLVYQSPPNTVQCVVGSRMLPVTHSDVRILRASQHTNRGLCRSSPKWTIVCGLLAARPMYPLAGSV